MQNRNVIFLGIKINSVGILSLVANMRMSYTLIYSQEEFDNP